MIFNLFVKAGRIMCSVEPGEKLTAEKEALAALIGAMMLLALMAFGTALALVRLGRMDQIEGLIMVLAAGVPWVVFDFYVKPSSQWLSPNGQ